ncbi:MAG: hypothetical protein JSR18_06575 [Proteobacteria bacterium]|nr:hypothetical protein [Pseudomonadota bacterium]
MKAFRHLLVVLAVLMHVATPVAAYAASAAAPDFSALCTAFHPAGIPTADTHGIAPSLGKHCAECSVVLAAPLGGTAPSLPSATPPRFAPLASIVEGTGAVRVVDATARAPPART